MAKKELYAESEWTRVAPKWKFWNKQERKVISCTKCDWQYPVNRTHHSAMGMHAASFGLSTSLWLHAEKHQPKKKKS
jgi:hypothetical protein